MAEEPKTRPVTPFPMLPGDKAFYFNGFGIGIGGGDFAFTLFSNGVPILTLNAAFSVAKTFGEAIVENVQKVEAATGHKILTVAEIASRTNPASASQSKK